MKISRRTMLSGFGVSLGLPLLDAMAPRIARSDVENRTRMVVFNTPNGFYRPAMACSGAGAAYSAGASMGPLAALRPHLLMVSGVDNVPSSGDAHSPHAHLLSCGPFATVKELAAGQFGVKRASFDQWLGKKLSILGKQARSLELSTKQRSVSDDAKTSVGQPTLVKHYFSWSAPETYVRPNTDLVAVYRSLFGITATTSDEKAKLEALIARKQTVIDFVLPRANALRSKLGRGDQAVLDKYLDSVRDVERGLVVSEASCDKGAESAFTGTFGHAKRVRLMCDLMVLALQCDRTRLITYSTDYETVEVPYAWVPVPDDVLRLSVPGKRAPIRANVVKHLAELNYHSELSHHGEDPDKIAAVRLIDEWHLAQFAYFVDQLRTRSDGASTLLDNSMVLFTGSLAEGKSHNTRDLPCVLAGRGGGAVLPGRHLRAATGTAAYHGGGGTYEGVPFANLLASMADAMGFPVDGGKFGNGTGKLSLK